MTQGKLGFWKLSSLSSAGIWNQHWGNCELDPATASGRNATARVEQPSLERYSERGNQEEGASLFFLLHLPLAPPTGRASQGATSSSVQFSHSVESLFRSRGLQRARLPCTSPTPGACSNSSSSSQWCHPTISSCHRYNSLISVWDSLQSHLRHLICLAFYGYCSSDVHSVFTPFFCHYFCHYPIPGNY